MPLDESTMEAQIRLVTEPHLRLLKEFGKNTLTMRISDKDKEVMWDLASRQARVQHLPREVVVEAWKRYVGGVSIRSGLAVNGDIDPEFTTVGVTYDNVLTASHTTKTRSLIEKLLRIWRRSFDSEERFLEAAERLTNRSLGQPRPKKRKQR